MPRRAAQDRQQAESVERAKQVATLRLEEGLSQRQIGERLGCSHTTVQNLWKKWMEFLREETAEEMAVAREMELRRLDKLWETAFRDATSSVEPEDRARGMTAALRIVEARRKILGLDAPMPVELMGKDGGPIDMKNTFDLSGLEGAALDEELKGFFNPGHVETPRAHTSQRKPRKRTTTARSGGQRSGQKGGRKAAKTGKGSRKSAATSGTSKKTQAKRNERNKRNDRKDVTGTQGSARIGQSPIVSLGQGVARVD